MPTTIVELLGLLVIVIFGTLLIRNFWINYKERRKRGGKWIFTFPFKWLNKK